MELKKIEEENEKLKEEIKLLKEKSTLSFWTPIDSVDKNIHKFLLRTPDIDTFCAWLSTSWNSAHRQFIIPLDSTRTLKIRGETGILFSSGQIEGELCVLFGWQDDKRFVTWVYGFDERGDSCTFYSQWWHGSVTGAIYRHLLLCLRAVTQRRPQNVLHVLLRD